MSEKIDKMIVEKEEIMKNIIKIWSTVSSVPKPSFSKIVEVNENGVTIESVWEFQDLQRRKMASTAHTYLVKNIDKNVDVSRVVHEISTSCIGYHPTSGIRVSLKTEGEAQYLEIWNKTKRTFFMDVAESKEHGLINNKGSIIFQWYENKLLYLAKPKRKDTSFFKHPLQSPDFELSTNMAHEFDYEDDWGETMMGNHHPVLCILDTESYKVTTENPLNDVSIGEAVWAPDGSIVFVGLSEEPYRLGQAACLNRKSAIYRYDPGTGTTEPLTDPPTDNNHVRSPRFDPNGRYLVYLQNSSNGCHQKCSQLVLYDWQTKKHRIVVDIVRNPTAEDFPGIFTDHLPERGFASDSSHIFFTTLWHEQQKTIGVNLEHGSVTDVTLGWTGCSAVLDVYQDRIVILCENVHEEPFLKLGQLQLTGDKVKVECYNLDTDAPKHVTNMHSSVLSYASDMKNSSYSGLCHILLLKPDTTPVKPEYPLIIWIHGGPHSCFASQYNAIANGFVKLGFVVAMINYRGSTGYGENYINSLAGNIGDQDVSDVKCAISYTKEHMTKLGSSISNTFIFGGSHGGFLGAHLCAQCPTDFDACVLRNPVTNVATMTEISDIPDWSFSESGMEFNFEAPNLEQICAMYTKSPIKDVKQVITPTLLLLGKQDRRVPYSQGINYYRNLKKNNVEVRVCVYDDGHALKTVAASADGFVQTAVWFLSHMLSENKEPFESKNV